MGSWFRRLLYLFRQSHHDADLRDEIEAHRSLRQAHLEQQGRAPADPSFESQRALGNTLLAREEVREVWLGSWNAWWQDVRYGTRTLATNRGFALVSMLTLALCIGASTAVFSVVHAVVLRPLPYAVTIDGDVNAGKQGPRTVEIVGVMPAIFFFPDKATDVWEPAKLYWRWARESSSREFRRWAVVARLGAGATAESAGAELRSIGGQLASLHAAEDRQGVGFVPNVVLLSDQLTGVSVKRTLWMLLSAVGLVLLIGCTNVANLTLARGASRQSEFAVRRALGAGRARIVRQLLVESLLLALIGGSLGLLFAKRL